MIRAKKIVFCLNFNCFPEGFTFPSIFPKHSAFKGCFKFMNAAASAEGGGVGVCSVYCMFKVEGNDKVFATYYAQTRHLTSEFPPTYHAQGRHSRACNIQFNSSIHNSEHSYSNNGNPDTSASIIRSIDDSHEKINNEFGNYINVIAVGFEDSFKIQYDILIKFMSRVWINFERFFPTLIYFGNISPWSDLRLGLYISRPFTIRSFIQTEFPKINSNPLPFNVRPSVITEQLNIYFDLIYNFYLLW